MGYDFIFLYLNMRWISSILTEACKKGAPVAFVGLCYAVSPSSCRYITVDTSTINHSNLLFCGPVLQKHGYFEAISTLIVAHWQQLRFMRACAAWRVVGLADGSVGAVLFICGWHMLLHGWEFFLMPFVLSNQLCLLQTDVICSPHFHFSRVFLSVATEWIASNPKCVGCLCGVGTIRRLRSKGVALHCRWYQCQETVKPWDSVGYHQVANDPIIGLKITNAVLTKTLVYHDIDISLSLRPSTLGNPKLFGSPYR